MINPDDSLKRARDMKRLLDSSSSVRNKIARRYGLVEYRCKRGCFLGAVVRHEGHKYLYALSNIFVCEVGRFLGDDGQPLGLEPGTLEYDYVMSAVAERERKGDAGEYEIWLDVDTIKEMMLLDPLARDELGDSACYEWSDLLSDTRRVNCNCRHSEIVKTPEEIDGDIERLRSARKKTIYVEPSAGRV